MSVTAFQPADQIVVPVQGTDREYLAQQWAVEFAGALGLPVHAVHITDGTEEDGPVDVFAFVEGIAKKHSVRLTTATLQGTDVVQTLVDELTPRDLVVIGTRRLSRHYHVGSVAAGLVEKAPCPVQVVRLE